MYYRKENCLANIKKKTSLSFLYAIVYPIVAHIHAFVNRHPPYTEKSTYLLLAILICCCSCSFSSSFFKGESNVYTLGNIGAHRIVSTKLPSVGSTREAMTATGNTTTRLLGTFQKVDYVFIVGVAGGVPHYTDYKKHVRLGDVVISYVDKQRALSNR